MNINNYKQFFTKEYLMGPTSLKLLDELLANARTELQGYTMDLGCGTGLTSLFLAKETGAEKIFAVDLWISAADNWRRAREWNVQNKLIPIHADGNDLPFADGFFQNIVSVDTYHYFGGKPGFFAEKILPLLAPGGSVLLAMPGVKEESMRQSPLMQEWAGDELEMFHSLPWWKETIQSGAEGVSIRGYESARCAEAWQDWFASGHEYALRDKQFHDRGLHDMLNFVMLEIRKEG